MSIVSRLWQIQGDISGRGQEDVLQLSEVAKRFLMISPRPVKVERIQSGLSSIKVIELPVITDMNDLARLDAHLST